MRPYQKSALRFFALGIGIAALVFEFIPGMTLAVAHGQTTTFEFTGGVQTFVVPAGVTLLNVDARGAEGGSGPESGGRGGQVQTTIAVTPGETLYITVGGAGGNNSGSTAGAGGFNGGGVGGTGCRDTGCARGGGGGGGASDIRQDGTALAHRVVVAGGGGGGAGFPGGNGGGLVGADGGAPRDDINGDGGTQTAGGTGCASNGTLGQGGTCKRARTSGALPGNRVDCCARLVRMGRGTYLGTRASCLRIAHPT